MHTKGPFSIGYASRDGWHVASEVARNLLQYYGADSELAAITSNTSLISAAAAELHLNGNHISIFHGLDRVLTRKMDAPFFFQDECLCIKTSTAAASRFAFKDGLGLICLCPLPNQRLELVIWGFDHSGLHRAARLIPLLPGVGQPDFIVVGDQMAVKLLMCGLAMCTIEYNWSAASASYIQP